MNRFVFLWLQQKRMLKKKSFWFLILFFIGSMLFLAKSVKQDPNDTIVVAVCIESDDPLAVSLGNRLTAADDSLFSFQQVSSREELQRVLVNGTAECGYLVSKPLSYELSKNHVNRLVSVYVTDRTTCVGVINEYVYSVLYEEYAELLVTDTILSDNMLPFTPAAAASHLLPPVTVEEIHKRYRDYTTGNELFNFDFFTVSDGVLQDTPPKPLQGVGKASVISPLFRSLPALFLLLGGFLALLCDRKDEENGLFIKESKLSRLIWPMLSMFSVLLLFAFASALVLILTGTWTRSGIELLALLVYILLLTLFYRLLSLLLRNTDMLCGALPMLVLLTLLFTPAVTDLGSLVPALRPVRYLLPTYYYLQFF